MEAVGHTASATRKQKDANVGTQLMFFFTQSMISVHRMIPSTGRVDLSTSIKPQLETHLEINLEGHFHGYPKSLQVGNWN